MMRIDGRLAGVMATVLTLAACAPQAVAPTVPVMPGQGKPFDQFANDQATCEAFANQQIAPLTQQANNNGLGQALLTTALGAGLGAAIGGGRGAAIGAASGAVVGSSMGASNSARAGMSIQQQYNMFYAQCMSSKGNAVPGAPGIAPPPPAYGPGPGAPVPPPPR
ncbi:MAG TPA: YMGG-like glycine zipper-containing protein [Stellaceae bacterium]|jgi:outer membrane lipoprotein SlyB|nr:YMGG-like glycine zipper-containing protein [Stellaceae bacterium]